MFRPGSVDEFKSVFGSKGGAARPNLYHVLLPRIGDQSPRDMSFMCTSVTLPSRQISTVAREIGADIQQVAYGFNNPEVSMTFRVMNDQGTRRYFESWMDSIIKRVGDAGEGRYVAGYADTYCQKVHIYQLEKGFTTPLFNVSKDINLGPISLNLDIDVDAGTSGFANYHWLLDRAFPKSIQYETFTDASQNEISQFTVEFSYKSWQGEYLEPADKGKVGITGTGAAATNAASKVTNKIFKALN